MKFDHPSGKGPANLRGLAASPAEPRFLVIGRVIKPHGIGGELRIESYTDVVERFSWAEAIFVGDKNPIEHTVENVRFHKKWVLIKFSEIIDRNMAELYRAKLLQIRTEDAIPLEEDEYFLFQVVGLQVTTIDGSDLGEIVDVIETKANNVFVVKSGPEEILIPDTPEVIKDIDFDLGTMTIELIPGLI
jgi:16S rRNA processing protein RimM